MAREFSDVSDQTLVTHLIRLKAERDLAARNRNRGEQGGYLGYVVFGPGYGRG